MSHARPLPFFVSPPLFGLRRSRWCTNTGRGSRRGQSASTKGWTSRSGRCPAETWGAWPTTASFAAAMCVFRAGFYLRQTVDHETRLVGGVEGGLSVFLCIISYLYERDPGWATREMRQSIEATKRRH